MKAAFLSRFSIYTGDYNCLFRNSNNELTAKLHYHDFYEIVIYLGCAGVFKINDKEYEVTRGDIALINMFDPHTLIYNKNMPYERFSICIDPNLLLSFNTPHSNLLNIFSKENKNYPVFHVEDKFFEKYLNLLDMFSNEKPEYGKDIFEKALIHQLTAYLFNDCYDGIHFDNADSRHISAISELVNYINDHLNEDLSLNKLARKINYSEYYMCRIFKKVTNSTLTNYIVEKRIEQACRLLNSGIPVNKIAEKAGFHNYSYFYKTFKRHTGKSPSEYKEQQ